MTNTSLIPLQWVRCPIAKLQDHGAGNIYLIPFHPPENLGVKHLTKIGCGGSHRVTQVIRDAQKAGLSVDGDSVFVCKTSDAFKAEKFLHEHFYRRRISSVDIFGFKGSTELFGISPSTIKKIKNFCLQKQEPFCKVKSQIVEQEWKGQYIRDGMIPLALHEKLSPSSFETGGIKLRLHRIGYREPVNANSLHVLRIDWFTFVGQVPLEMWGNPTKDSPEWNQAINELKLWQSQMDAFLSQWNLTNEGYLELVNRIESSGSISLRDVVKLFPRYAIRVEVCEWQHPILMELAAPQPETLPKKPESF